MENQKLQLIKRQESFKFVVEENLERIIRILCDKFPRNEYSGTLFYTISGSIEGGDLVVYGKDFYIQDIGEGTYTEFQNDVSLAGYMADHELWDCYTGLMHSHNVMATFFSGTDTNTLQSEGTEQNHFVSLIINNDGKYNAAITRRVHAELNVITSGTKTESYRTWNDELKTTEAPFSETSKKEANYIEYFPLDVTVTPYKFEKDELDARVEELRRSAKSYINRGRALGSPSISSGSSNNFPFWGKEPVVIGEYGKPIESKKEAPKYKEPSLFPEYEEVSEIDYDSFNFDKELIRKHITQLITGNIMAGMNPKLDLEKWCANMENIYNKRFPNTDDIEAFTMYAEAFIEMLSSEAQSRYKEIDIDMVLAIWANELTDSLLALPSTNWIIDIYVDILSRWLI